MPTPIRERGTAAAYPVGFFEGTSPEFSEADSTWVSVPGGWAKNVFKGTTLYQNLVTPGTWDVPRRSKRVIYNYDTPAQADTVYIDARGDKRPKHPTFFSKTHSKEFMNSVDHNLEGMVPQALNAREAKALQGKKLGGTIRLIPHK